MKRKQEDKNTGRWKGRSPVRLNLGYVEEKSPVAVNLSLYLCIVKAMT